MSSSNVNHPPSEADVEHSPEADSVPAQGEHPGTAQAQQAGPRTGESGGPLGPEPTRFGDWEKNGRCIDF